MTSMPSSASDALADRVGSLYAQLPASLLGQALAAGGLGLLFLGVPGTQRRDVVVVWLLLALLAWGWRWRLLRHYQQCPAHTVGDWPVWQRRWTRSTLACVAVWALAMLWLYPLGGELQRAGMLVVAFAAVLLVGHQQRQGYARLQSFKHRSERLAAQLAAEKDIAEQARLDAEAATRARTQFFTAASHDLRQPLHALVLFTESLRLRNRDTTLEPTITSIGASVDALEALFDKLMDLTSIDSGAIVVDPKPFHMRELYARLRLHFEPQAFDKGLGLDFVGGRHAVWADPLLVERILRNLVSNAIRYTEDGGILVSCRTRSDRLLLQVWDTGIGIDPRLLPSIFDEFYQVTPPPTPDAVPRKGLGLGLAIVRRLAELLHAPLSVCSRPGHGTVFSLLLPSALSAAGEGAAGLAVGAVPVWSRPTLAGRHVVLVGAELDTSADSPGAMLQAWGARVSAFHNTTAVLDWSTSQPGVPDLVLIGHTPAHERSGVELVRALRLVFGAALPAVLLSDSRGDAQADALAAAEPGIHLLARPVAPNRLRAMVNFKLSARTISHPDL